MMICFDPEEMIKEATKNGEPNYYDIPIGPKTKQGIERLRKYIAHIEMLVKQQKEKYEH